MNWSVELLTRVVNMSYDKSFFVNRRTLTLASADKILEVLWKFTQPKSMLDIGCATGIWLAEGKRKGATSLFGVDGSWVPRDELEIDASEFCEQDLENISLDVGEFDLALSIEVAEHLTEDSGQKLVEFLTSHSDMVLFSAAVPGQGGRGHVNERLQSYWYEKFSKLNFECFDLIRPLIWGDEEVNLIYKQNMLLYVRKGSNAYNHLSSHEYQIPKLSVGFDLDRIHPDLLWIRVNDRPLCMMDKLKKTWASIIK